MFRSGTTDESGGGGGSGDRLFLLGLLLMGLARSRTRNMPAAG